MDTFDLGDSCAAIGAHIQYEILYNGKFPLFSLLKPYMNSNQAWLLFM